MNEPIRKTLLNENRLNEVRTFDLVDTSRERELDELASIAAAICQTPVGLVTILNHQKQWFKANIGLPIDETPVDQAFCAHTLDKPKEVLVVEDAHDSHDFKDNPLVTGTPGIRFYAGAPMVTSNGHVLGTLCVMDFNPRTINNDQIEALKLLSRKAMDFIEARKTIKNQELDLQRKNAQLDMLSDDVMATLFEISKQPSGYAVLNHLSESVRNLHPTLSADALISNPNLCLELIDDNHRDAVLNSLANAVKNDEDWTCEFNIPADDGDDSWFKLTAKVDEASKLPNRDTVWRGIIYENTIHKKFEQCLEQMTIDMAHIVRKPVTSMLALSALINQEFGESERASEYMKLLTDVSVELDATTKELTRRYESKLQELK